MSLHTLGTFTISGNTLEVSNLLESLTVLLQNDKDMNFDLLIEGVVTDKSLFRPLQIYP